MNYQIIVLVDPANYESYNIRLGADTISEAIGVMETEWERFIDTRITNLVIKIINSEGECVDDRCLDDAQLYYDHRMYRVGQLERTYLDLGVPLEERQDQRLFDTNIIIGWRDNLDAHIAVAVKPGHQPITSEYLTECWQEHLFRQELRREEVLKEIPLDVARDVLPELFS